MEKVYEEFHNRGVEFFLIYVREAHPGEKIPHHESYEQKVQLALRFRQEENVTVPILVDGLEGPVHRAYGNLANQVYIVDQNGIIVFKAQWAEAHEVRVALEELLLREKRLAEGHILMEAFIEKMSFPVIRYLPERERVLTRAGQKAVTEFEQGYGKMNPA